MILFSVEWRLFLLISLLETITQLQRGTPNKSKQVKATNPGTERKEIEHSQKTKPRT